MKRLFLTDDGKLDLSFLAGVITILIWSTIPAIKRLTGENIPVLIAAAINFSCGGLFNIAFRLGKAGFNKPSKEKIVGSLLTYLPYVIYTSVTSFSITLASDREAAMIINLITSIWPLSALICSIIFNKKKVSIFFPFACLLSIIGIVIAGYSGNISNMNEIISNNALPLFLAVIEVISWGVYSGMFTKHIKAVKDDYQPFAMLTTGLIMTALVLIKDISIEELSIATMWPLIFQIVMNSIISTSLWNYAMMGPRNFELMLLSNISPFITTLLSAIILGLGIEIKLLIGAAVVVASTLLAKRCIN